MNPSRSYPISRALGFARRFSTASEGMVATEFALISPVMIAIFFGVTELCDGLEAGTKVTQVASSAADLIAQEKVVCNAEMTDVFSALNQIMVPYPTNNMLIRISSVVDGGNGTAKVAWSDAQNMTPRLVNSLVSDIPAGLIETSGSVILAEVTYNYTNPTGQWLTGTIAMTDKFYLHPRKVAQITRTVNTC